MRENAVHPNVAANRLGIPIADVYARIRSGELEAEKHGNRWIVILPANLQDWQRFKIPTDTDRSSSGSLNGQHSEEGVAIDEICARLVTLEADFRAFTAAATDRQAMARPSIDDGTPEEAPTKIRLSAIRPRLLALSAIIGLTLSGVGIQSSSAQRSDDLTVAFVFACGAVTGSIAAWLALEKQPRPSPNVGHGSADRGTRSEHNHASNSVRGTSDSGVIASDRG